MEAGERPDRTIDRFDPDPTKSFTMAAHYYTDPSVAEAERRAIFHRSWLYVGHRSQLATPGDYITAELGGQRVFVVHDAGGDLAAYFNVCLHRGHSLLSGAGRLPRLISCPYHGWAYDHGGRLVGARMADRMADFDHDEFALPPVAVAELCGLVFVNLDPDPEPIDRVYPGAAEALAGFGVDIASLRAASVSHFDIAGNWKNVADNLLECYHCHPAHPGFVDLIEMDTYCNETHTGWSIQSGRHRVDNNTYSIDSGHPAFTSLFMWPNLSIGFIPGQRGVLLFHFEPTGPETTSQTVTFLSPDGSLTETEQRAFDFFNEVLGPEDVALVEDVQVGLNSLGYHQGRFICIPDRPEISEHAVHHFHEMVLDALAEVGAYSAAGRGSRPAAR